MLISELIDTLKEFEGNEDYGVYIESQGSDLPLQRVYLNHINSEVGIIVLSTSK
jgi:hypothetical protein